MTCYFGGKNVIISRKRIKKLDQLQENINYKFKDISLLNAALAHSSFINENKKGFNISNERLEFLGDAVIDLIVSEYLYKRFAELPEGKLTKIRASIVCESSLAFAARKIDIGAHMLLGKGEELTGGRNKASLLADAFEALTAAIYLDSGLEKAKDFLLSNFEQEVIYEISKGNLFVDYKTELQESVQKKRKLVVEYRVEKEVGPDHSKRFYIDVIAKNKVIGKGIGRSKKEAEQNAAKYALIQMGEAYE